MTMFAEELQSYTVEQWLEALKSGKYTHVKHKLGHKGFETINACCLGVLVHDATQGKSVDDASRIYCDHYDHEGMHKSLQEINIGVGPHWLFKPVTYEMRHWASSFLSFDSALVSNVAHMLMQLNDRVGARDYSAQIEFIERFLL